MHPAISHKLAFKKSALCTQSINGFWLFSLDNHLGSETKCTWNVIEYPDSQKLQTGVQIAEAFKLNAAS